MGKIIDPKEFGLHPRTVIEVAGKDKFAIVINRKSRIIMSDGEKILEKAEKIIKVRPKARVGFKTSAPICSKTAAFLKKHEIDII